MSPSRQEDPRIRGGRRYSSSESAPTVKGPPDPRGRRVVRCASSHLLRLFPSAALPHPPLRLFFSYSEGSRGVAEGKRRSRRGRGRARGHRCARGRRPIRLFRPIGPARLAADANGPAGGAARRLGKATGAHLPASAPRPSSSSHSSTNPDEKGSISRARDISEPFSPEPMAQGPGPARRCGKDGRRVDVARTGASHLASTRPLPRHHADPGQSGGLPGEKGSLWGSGVDQVQEGARRAGPRGRRRVGRDRRTEGGEEGAEDGDASCLKVIQGVVLKE